MTPKLQVLSDELIDEIDTAHNWQTTAGRAAAFRAIESATLAALAQQAHGNGGDDWMPMADAPSQKTVLLAYRNEYGRVRVVLARHVQRHTEEAGEDDQATECKEDDGTYYVTAGWYEDNSEAEINYGITGEFLGWKPKPHWGNTTPQPQPAPQVPAPVDEREAFERAAHQEGCTDFRRVGEAYSDRRTLRCYRIWKKARAALQSTAPQTKGQP